MSQLVMTTQKAMDICLQIQVQEYCIPQVLLDTGMELNRYRVLDPVKKISIPKVLDPTHLQCACKDITRKAKAINFTLKKIANLLE